MADLLIMLSPPRSFSSVLSTVIGEHPDLYGFPELHLFVTKTVGKLLEHSIKNKRYGGPHGLLRTLAQLNDGVQTNETITRAMVWLHDRQDWSTKEVMDYLIDKISPRIGVEKSPITSRHISTLKRAYKQYPNAFFLHLVRHPISATKSLDEFKKDVFIRGWNRRLVEVQMDHMMVWYEMHNNIIKFTRKLPVGQTTRIRGEDLLSEPNLYLTQFSEWMGIRTDEDAINAMKHPENSPYARVGPDLARGGNDHKFMLSPKLRHGKVKEPSLEANLSKLILELDDQKVRDVSRRMGLKDASAEDIAHEITKLANLMGYY